jgi:hypothetical protein
MLFDASRERLRCYTVRVIVPRSNRHSVTLPVLTPYALYLMSPIPSRTRAENLHTCVRACACVCVYVCMYVCVCVCVCVFHHSRASVLLEPTSCLRRC